jgi:HD-GYP domain-containing protein (c-di-GMP phosphodiesterase class II)
MARAMAGGKRWSREFDRAFCEVAARIAERLDLGPGVRRSLNEILERWDGKGGPRGLRGEDVALPARFAQVAEQAVLFERRGGLDAAVATVRERAGRMLDPSIAMAFSRLGSSLFQEIRSGDPLARVVGSEPEPYRTIPEWDVDRVAEAFADFADLKTPFLRGHSTGVAHLAEGASRQMGLSEAEVTGVRRAALLHDLGRVGIPNGTWERSGPLGAAEWEQVRLHPYHSERIMMRSPLLAPSAPIAGMHHERSDGSGYYRQVSRAAIPISARLLAAADPFQAMTQPRPHREALDAEEAATALLAEAEAGRLDPEAVTAVLTAAGRHAASPRRHWPAGLSDREVEVLRLIAQGLATKEVARRLFISPKTADHHIQHIYTKIGVSTRAGASLFAMEQGLLAPRAPPSAQG